MSRARITMDMVDAATGTLRIFVNSEGQVMAGVPYKGFCEELPLYSLAVRERVSSGLADELGYVPMKDEIDGVLECVAGRALEKSRWLRSERTYTSAARTREERR